MARVSIESGQETSVRVKTFGDLSDDPATAPLLKRMCGGDGKPYVCDPVWISYLTGSGSANGEGVIA